MTTRIRSEISFPSFPKVVKYFEKKRCGVLERICSASAQIKINEISFDSCPKGRHYEYIKYNENAFHEI